MANRQIYRLDPATTPLDLTRVFASQISDGSVEAEKSTLQELLDVYSALPVVTVTPQGTDDSTTSELSYGVNVITTSTTSNFCTRLPETPTEGRSVTIINTSSYILRVFPSITGGSINGVVDGYVDVIPNSQAYTIYCYDNPDPGEWGGQAVPSTILAVNEMHIDHVNTVADQYSGLTTLISGATSVGLDGNHNLTLSPAVTNWGSLDSITSFVKLKVETNIVAADIPSGSPNVNRAQLSINRGFKSAENSSNLDLGNGIVFINSGIISGTGGAVNGGVLSSPPEVGNVGTFYGEQVQVNGSLGLGGEFSRYYYIFTVVLGAALVTKTYKFKFTLEYV